MHEIRGANKQLAAKSVWRIHDGVCVLAGGRGGEERSKKIVAFLDFPAATLSTLVPATTQQLIFTRTPKHARIFAPNEQR